MKVALSVAVMLIAGLFLWRMAGNPARTDGVGESSVDSADPTTPAQPVSAGVRELPVEASCRALLETLDTEPDPDSQEEAMDRSLDSIAARDPAGALDFLVQDRRAVSVELCRRLVRRWAENDPAAAAEWAAQAPDELHDDAVEEVAIAWVNEDLAAATNWLASLPEGDGQVAAVVAAAYEVARDDPRTALVLAAGIPSSPVREDLAVHAVSQWAAGDATAATDWVMQVTDAGFRQQLLAAVAIAAAKQNGPGAAALAAETLPGGPDLDRAVVAIVQRWAERSPEAAAAWVAQFPEIPSRAPAIQNLLSVWTAQNPAAAQNWLVGLPPGPVRDIGYSFYPPAIPAK